MPGSTPPPADPPPTLRPLVPKGADRDAILDQLVEDWATPSEPLDMFDTDEDAATRPGALIGIDLIDENDGAGPIDLGDLLRRAADRFREQHPPADDDKENRPAPHPQIVLRRCRVHACKAAGVSLTARLDARHTEFQGYADFREAKFQGYANFSEAKFQGNADFREAKFQDYASFRKAKFQGYADFSEADLRRARVAGTLLRRWPRRRTRWRYAATGRLHWRRVRQLGELQALTRAGYAALIAVPLLAGVWGPARVWIAQANGAMDAASDLLRKTAAATAEHPEAAGLLAKVEAVLTAGTLPETMPLSWLLAFVASAYVALGHLLYQILAPQLIKERTEQDLVDTAEETNRRDGKITDERLRQAIGRLHSAAQATPHRRSVWFVQREGRTVWLPNHLPHYEDAKVRNPDWDGDAEDERAWIKAPDQQVTGEDRKRIMIEEGERARYDRASFTVRWGAWLSGGCYAVGGWLIIVILGRQLHNIALASPADWLAWLVGWSQWGWLTWAVTALLTAATLAGAIAATMTPPDR